jgi:cytochrome c7-like protein
MKFKDAAHLFRMAAVFAVGILIFVLARNLFVPKSFGQYGHYRGDALAEVRALPVHYAGHQVCESCHSDVLDVKTKGKHARVNCEACHGPLATHTEDPGGVMPEKLDTAKLCVKCHEENSAKPKNFPQVVSADHSAGLACNECHQPHSPIIATEAPKATALPEKHAAVASAKGAKK